MSNNLTLHLIQWRIIPGDVEGNLGKAEAFIESASPGIGDMVVLPEMFPSGFYYPDLGAMADEFGAVAEWMGKVASRFEIAVAGSAPARHSRGISNRLILVDRTGEILASYDKIHLFFAADEDLHFAPGHQTVVTQWNGISVGLAICFDLRFPEVTRDMCDSGAQLAVVPAQWPGSRVDHFRDFTRVRAMENQMFIASCNSCGDDGRGLVLGGRSTVVGPSGEVKGVLGDEEGVLTVTIDMDEVEQTRKSFPVLKVRRKDLFGK